MCLCMHACAGNKTVWLWQIPFFRERQCQDLSPKENPAEEENPRAEARSERRFCRAGPLHEEGRDAS